MCHICRQTKMQMNTGIDTTGTISDLSGQVSCLPAPSIRNITEKKKKSNPMMKTNGIIGSEAVDISYFILYFTLIHLDIFLAI